MSITVLVNGSIRKSVADADEDADRAEAAAVLAEQATSGKLDKTLGNVSASAGQSATFKNAVFIPRQTNVLEAGADKDGGSDAQPAFQTALVNCEDNGFSTLTIPLAAGQIYKLSNSVVGTKGNVAVIGDRAPAKFGFPAYNPPSGGYITAPQGTDPLFLFSGGTDADKYGAYHMEKLGFYFPRPSGGDFNNRPCVLVSPEENAPHRPMNFIGLSASGWQDVLVFDCTDVNVAAAANVVMEYCHFTNNFYIVRAENRILGFAMRYCVSEGGSGRITGKLEDAVAIEYNQLEFTANFIDIYGTTRTQLYFGGNYLEANLEDFVIRFNPESAYAECAIGQNTGWHLCNTTDLVLLRGIGRVRLEQSVIPWLTDDQATNDGLPIRRELCSLQGAGYIGELNHQGFMAYRVNDDDVVSNSIILPYEQYVATSGSFTTTRDMDAGDTINAPFGESTTGLSTNEAAGIATITGVPNLASGDMLAICLLVKITADDLGVLAAPTFRVFGDASQILGTVDFTWAAALDGKYHLFVATLPIMVANTGGSILIYGGPLGIGAGASGFTMEVAGAGYARFQAASLDAEKRAHVRPQCP